MPEERANVRKVRRNLILYYPCFGKFAHSAECNRALWCAPLVACGSARLSSLRPNPQHRCFGTVKISNVAVLHFAAKGQPKSAYNSKRSWKALHRRVPHTANLGLTPVSHSGLSTDCSRAGQLTLDQHWLMFGSLFTIPRSLSLVCPSPANRSACGSPAFMKIIVAIVLGRLRACVTEGRNPTGNE